MYGMEQFKHNKQSLEEEKRCLRQAVKSKFRAQNQEELNRQNRIIEEKLESLSVYRDSRVVMFYWSMPGEVDTRSLIRKAEEMKKIIALPVIKDNNVMHPYQFSAGARTVNGPFGVLQPDINSCVQVEAKDLDIVLVPAVAFDKQGRRLGRGNGYYDRFLDKLSARTCKIGLAFSFQFLDKLPFNPLQDREVDAVISP